MCSNKEHDCMQFEMFFKEEDRKEYNNTRKYYRHNRSLDKLHIDISFSQFDIIDFFDLLDQIENFALYRALKQLNNIDLQILKLKYIHKFTLNEIASILELNPNTVKKKHSRAIKRIRELVK